MTSWTGAMWSSWFCHWLTHFFYCMYLMGQDELFEYLFVIRLCILELCCQPWIRFRGLHFSRKEPINFAISTTCQPYWEILPSIKVFAFPHKHNGMKKFPMEFFYVNFICTFVTKNQSMNMIKIIHRTFYIGEIIKFGLSEKHKNLKKIFLLVCTFIKLCPAHLIFW